MVFKDMYLGTFCRIPEAAMRMYKWDWYISKLIRKNFFEINIPIPWSNQKATKMLTISINSYSLVFLFAHCKFLCHRTECFNFQSLGWIPETGFTFLDLLLKYGFCAFFA